MVNKETRRRFAVVLIVLALSSALLVAQSVAVRKVLFVSFSRLEQKQGERGIDQVVKALETDLNQLAINTHDYAVWDDAVEFVRRRDQRFIDSNVTAESLSNLNVNVVWMLDASRRDILTFERRPGLVSGAPSAASAEVMQALRPQLSGVLQRIGASSLDRLISTPKGLIAVAASPILPTGGQGDPYGYLIFGRFVNEEVIHRAHVTSQLPIDLFTTPASTASLPAAARALWTQGSSGDGRVLVPANDVLLRGFASLRDVTGRVVAITGTGIPRNLLAFGRETGSTLLGIFAAVVVVFAAVVAFLLLYLQKVAESRSASERRYRAVITQAQETMLLVDAQSRVILEANPAATGTLGFSNQELTGMQIDDLFYACDDDVLKPVHAETRAAVSRDRILLVRRQNKEFIDVEVTASPLVIDDRDVTSFVLRDVSGRKRAERELVYSQDRMAHLAHHDALTGLLNRLGLERRLPEFIESARRSGASAAFMYIDMDHFKKINDLRGHSSGDKLLQIAADRLRGCLSAEDLVVRMGGDEFVVVAGKLRDAANAGTVAERVRQSLCVPFEIGDQRLAITASIGVSLYPNDGADYDVLLKNADIALYESKDAGRNTVTLFADEMTRKVTDRVAMEVELREALQNGQFYLDYQPLIDVKTRRIASFEALIRWHHPVRGRIPPAQFIGVAEHVGLICDIGEFVIRQACRQMGEWQQCGAQLVPVAVNVSSKQLEHREIVGIVESALRTARVDPSMLRIEITESVFMDTQDLRVQHLNELREMGVHVSVDDFGTGYSSLSYLKSLPIDCLKIDRSFVQDLDRPGADDAIVKAIIRMAQSLGLSIVAEGVERVGQLRRLGELGATYVQGFYFSPAVGPDLCGRLLQPSAESPTELLRSLGDAAA